MKDNHKYEAITYWSAEDAAFIARCLNWLDARQVGSYAQALDNVQVVIQEWIETAKEMGRPIPKPKGRLTFA